MDWYEPDVRELEAEAGRRALPRNPAVFYGSSSIRLWHTLAKDLHSTSVVNRGFGGSTLAACAYFFDRLVTPLQPRSLTLYAGDNDLGDGRSPDEVLASFRQLFSRAGEVLGAAPFGFISIKPSPARAGILPQIRRTNGLILDVLSARREALFIDVFTPMVDLQGRPRPELFLEDGLHLSRAGYELWIEYLAPYRHQLFIELQPDINTPRVLSKSGAQGVRNVVQPPPEP